ncbi:MAG: hypothetical protein IKC94_05930 [Lentisphaeria bacterium]|nr:hypothetical protein [Lentisphaeria bacterium]
MKKVLLAVFLLSLCGCINIDYTGRKFTPQENVQYVEKISDIQLDEYTLIGRFTVTSRLKVHPYDVEEKVLIRAGEYGGDILLRSSVSTVQHGIYTPDSREFGAPQAADRHRNPDEESRFGRQIPLTSNPATTKRRVFEYLLYKKTAEVNRQLGF